MGSDKAAFGEVIESSLREWQAQSWCWDKPPSFGSLVSVQAGTRTLVGVVHEISTGSTDPGRQPFAYGKTEDELREQQPQIFEFLRTTFSCCVVGYLQRGALRHTLAPEPPKIHAFVRPLEEDAAKRFLASAGYLYVLFAAGGQLMSLDELLLALLSYHEALGILSERSLGQFMQTYSLLTGNDYRRVKLFLHRAQQLL